MAAETSRITYFLRVLTFICGVGLIILGIISFITFGFGSIRGFFLRIYYILFGFLVCFSEMPCEKLLNCFHFLRLNLGTALFLLFLATITFTWDPIYYLIISIVFACTSVVYFVLFCGCMKTDQQQAEDNKAPNADGAKFSKKEDVIEA